MWFNFFGWGSSSVRCTGMFSAAQWSLAFSFLPSTANLVTRLLQWPDAVVLALRKRLAAFGEVMMSRGS